MSAWLFAVMESNRERYQLCKEVEKYAGIAIIIERRDNNELDF